MTQELNPHTRNRFAILNRIAAATGIAGLWGIAKGNGANSVARNEPATGGVSSSKSDATAETQGHEDIDELIRAINQFRDKLIGRGHLQSEEMTARDDKARGAPGNRRRSATSARRSRAIELEIRRSAFSSRNIP